MSLRNKMIVAVCVGGVVCLGWGPPIPKAAVCQQAMPEPVACLASPLLGEAEYGLLAGSVFAEGCMGGGPHGCMCPLQAASAFTGGFTLTPDPRTPPGHHAFDVILQDMIVEIDGQEMQLPGGGRYVKWTDLDGDSWHSMTLDVDLYGEAVHFSSGAVEDPAPGGGFPAEIQIVLDNNAPCYGYVISLAAQPVAGEPEIGGDRSLEACDDDVGHPSLPGS